MGCGGFVGGTGVAVGGTGVAVGGGSVGGTGVAVGGTGVLVGGTGVLVGGTGVLVGGTGVLVGGCGVAGAGVRGGLFAGIGVFVHPGSVRDWVGMLVGRTPGDGGPLRRRKATPPARTSVRETTIPQ
ncbi:MAG: hypothetical protein ACP5NB_13270 [Chloroflexia bacterium]